MIKKPCILLFVIAIIANQTQAQIATISSFQATQSTNTVIVTWTATQQNSCNHFTLERGANLTSFVTINNLPAANTTTTSINYQYNDIAPLNGCSYYRLKATAFNGSSAYLDTVSLCVVGIRDISNIEPIFICYFDQNYKTLKVKSSDQDYSIEILSIDGHILITKYFIDKESIVDCGWLDTGVYLVCIRSKNGVLTAKKIMIY